ncbi:MAG: hypothetical protein QF416_04220, partial [Candidatus Marinimicrobia bacterium]|nr:hypothetical protein [Candidatus Neomarinimicrobiota bacterium]
SCAFSSLSSIITKSPNKIKIKSGDPAGTVNGINQLIQQRNFTLHTTLISICKFVMGSIYVEVEANFKGDF